MSQGLDMAISLQKFLDQVQQGNNLLETFFPCLLHAGLQSGSPIFNFHV